MNQLGVTTMKNARNKLVRAWWAVLPAIGVATPAFGAAVRLPFDMWFSETDYVLGGLLLVLVVALVASISMRHAKNDQTIAEPLPEGPDLRWWKTHPQA